MAVGSTDECVAVENSFHILKINLVNAQVVGALLLVPSECANSHEQLPHIVFVVRHSESSPEEGAPVQFVPTESSL
jgi:hypothetical protein